MTPCADKSFHKTAKSFAVEQFTNALKDLSVGALPFEQKRGMSG